MSKLPKCTKVFDYDSVFFKALYEGKNKDKKVFSLITVGEQFVLREILNLNPAKSTGLDDIPARFIRDGASILKIPITFIVNMSITSGTVPDDMKVARVKPLYKENSSLEAGNYRPVSILSVVSKILEVCIFTTF